MSDTSGGSGPGERAATESLGQLLSEVSSDLSQLFRQEVELAKVELKESASRAGAGAGMLTGGAVAAHLALLFVSIALWWGIGGLIGRTWSALIIAVVYGIVAAVLIARGRAKLTTVTGAPKTAATVKKIPEALKPEGTR